MYQEAGQGGEESSQAGGQHGRPPRLARPFVMSRRALCLLACCVVATAGCGGGSDEPPPRPRDVPAGAVAAVGEAEVSKRDLAAEVAMLRRAQRGGRANRAGGGVRVGREQLESQALTTLLMREALEQEAANRNIGVTRAEVRRRWRAVSRRQFKTRRALRRFLGGRTESDLLDELRVQQLSERIHAQVAEQADGGKQGARAVRDFQADFMRRWQERIACADGHTAAGCAK
jgi:hypothetical protein